MCCVYNVTDEAATVVWLWKCSDQAQSCQISEHMAVKFCFWLCVLLSDAVNSGNGKMEEGNMHFYCLWKT